MANILQLSSRLSVNRDLTQSPNICERFTEDDLRNIGGHVKTGYDRDIASRALWQKRTESAMDLAMQIQKQKNFPWPDCSNVVFPLVTLAALQFSARSYSNIIQGPDVVRYRVVGEDQNGELAQRAARIAKHMSWQVLEQDTSWEEEHDRLLINLCIVGSTFIKTYFSPSLGHNVSELVMAKDFVLDYNAKSVEQCARKTHVLELYPNDVYERVQNGTFSDVLTSDWFNNRGTAVPPSQQGHDRRTGQNPPQRDEDTPFRFLEQHRFLDLDHDGYAEPYIVTVEEDSGKTVRIVSRWQDESSIERKGVFNKKIIRIHPNEHFTKYSFIPAPDGGIYDIGFGVLLGPLNESVNSAINQLLDAGTMSNSAGGFLGRGAKIRGGNYTMAPWEWKRVDSTGDDLRKSLVPLQVREPSAVLFNLLSLLINYTDRVAGTTDPMVGVNPGQNTPAETSRNMIEQGMQVYSVIFKRVWRSMKEEFKKLHQLNAIYLQDKSRYGTGGDVILREDYKSNPDHVIPVADPNVTSVAQRMQQAMALRQAAYTAPGYNIAEVERFYLRSLRIEGIERFYPGPDKVPPLPNPKMQIEQARLQEKMVKHKIEQWKFALELQEQKRLNTAQIAKLEAEVLSLMHSADADRAAAALDRFNSLIQAQKAYNDSLDSRAKLLIEAMQNEQSDRGDQPGGAGKLEGPQGNQGSVQEPSSVAGGNEGGMG